MGWVVMSEHELHRLEVLAQVDDGRLTVDNAAELLALTCRQSVATDRLAEFFCLRNKHYVSKDLTLKYDHKRIRLEVNDLTRGLVGKYADTYEFPDGRFQNRHKGIALPCTIVDPQQQRVTHPAITDNKHLGAVLAHIKAEQDKAADNVEVRPESARDGYRKNGRRNKGWNSRADRKQNAERKASQDCDM